MNKIIFKKQNGFSLLEVLVAATIIIVLTAVGVTSYVNITKKSRDARRTSDIEQIRQALEMHRSELGYYPNTNNGSWNSAANLSGALSPVYMPSIPADPKNSATTPYQYIATNQVGANYYGYCLSASLETATSTTSNCSSLPNASYNYGTRNP